LPRSRAGCSLGDYPVNAAQFHQLQLNGVPVDMALTAPAQATPRQQRTQLRDL